MPRRLLLAAAAALLSASPAATAAPRTFVVTIDAMKFGPVPAGIRKGDVIWWVNKDMFRHTATARDHSFDIDLQPSTKARMVVGFSGTKPFICRYHPGMKGVLRAQ